MFVTRRIKLTLFFLSCFNVFLHFAEALDISKLLPDKYRQGAYDLKSKYYPIEIDPNVTLQEKIPLMVEW